MRACVCVRVCVFACVRGVCGRACVCVKVYVCEYVLYVFPLVVHAILQIEIRDDIYRLYLAHAASDKWNGARWGDLPAGARYLPTTATTRTDGVPTTTGTDGVPTATRTDGAPTSTRRDGVCSCSRGASDGFGFSIIFTFQSFTIV